MSLPTRARPSTLIALAAITLASLALAASTWHVFGHTWDEPEHLAAGLALLDHGHYDFDIQHPPLARLLLAAGPYLAGARSQGKPPPDGRPEGVAILYGSRHYELYLSLARAGVLPFLALLIVMSYLWARNVLPPHGALVAAAFTATTPAVLGHAAIATLDVAAAATCLLALHALQRWLESGRLRDALLLGAASGLALGTKLSAIPFCGVGGAVLLALRAYERRALGDSRAPVPIAAWWGGGLLATLCVFEILTLAYGGRFIYLTDGHRFNQALWFLFGSSGTLHDLAYAAFAKFRVPEAFQWFLGGVQALTVHNDTGHLSYLLGETRLTGWWYFYLVALLVKTPLPLLVLGGGGLAVLVRRGFGARDARVLAVPALFLALLVLASAVSHINIGVRHVLVLYPLLATGAAVVVYEGGRACLAAPSDAARRAVLAGLGVLCLAELATVAIAWPDYLPYFNVAVREPERVLVDSDLDWGQDLRRLAVRLRDLHVPSVALAYLGTAELSREGLPPYRLLKADERATGWIAVTALARVHAPRRFDWLDAYPRRERIGTTIDLYFVPAAQP